jgi:TrmH family RNA methyltransferase
MDMQTVSIVLIGTTHSGNVGATARAMKTMGLADLRLVGPACEVDDVAMARASGAEDVLRASRRYPSLDEAIEDCGLVVGASARLRSLPWPVMDPRQAAGRVQAVGDARAAVLFGRERTGLTNAELERCHLLMHIPSDPGFSSLNLASAVQVFAYELHMARLSGAPREVRKDRLATGREMQHFYAHLEQALVDIGFLRPERPGRVIRRLKRLFNRAEVEAVEINILRGILGAIQARCKREA